MKIKDRAGACFSMESTCGLSVKVGQSEGCNDEIWLEDETRIPPNRQLPNVSDAIAATIPHPVSDSIGSMVRSLVEDDRFPIDVYDAEEKGSANKAR